MKARRPFSLAIRVWAVGLCLFLWAAFACGVLVVLPWVALRAWYQLVETSWAQRTVFAIGLIHFAVIVPCTLYYYAYAFGFRFERIPVDLNPEPPGGEPLYVRLCRGAGRMVVNARRGKSVN